MRNKTTIRLIKLRLLKLNNGRILRNHRPVINVYIKHMIRLKSYAQFYYNSIIILLIIIVV